MKSIALTLLLLLATDPLLFAARSSASYTMAVEGMDSGGQRATSAAYTHAGSSGGLTSMASFGTAAASHAKSGLIGQLYEVVGTTVATPSSPQAGGALVLRGWQALDDGTLLPVPDGLTFAWSFNGDDIPSATGETYVLPSAQPFHAGIYTVRASRADGSVMPSIPWTLTVTAPPPNPARLLNLSTRGLAGADANQLFPGFVVSGVGTKRLLIRAVGPSLGDLGVPFATLPDPRMELKRFNFTTQAYEDLETNDDWQTNPNAADITATAAQLFAFPYTDAKDAALLVDLPAGQYAVVGGPSTSSGQATEGIGIVELYDADPSAGSGQVPATSLINISNRGFCGVGDSVMIPGFVISSEGPKTVLVRVVGPTLGGFGVPGTMVDPKLEIFPAGSNTPILTNDNWGDNPDAAHTATIAAQVFAFPLAAGSADAAFVVTLPPGGYTVVGSSAVPGGTGVVLVEIYVVP